MSAMCAIHVGAFLWGRTVRTLGPRRAPSVCCMSVLHAHACSLGICTCAGLAPSACTDLVHIVMWRGFLTGWQQGQVLNGSRSTRVCRQLGLQAWAACRRRTDVAQTGAGSEDNCLPLLSLDLLSSLLTRTCSQSRGEPQGLTI